MSDRSDSNDSRAPGSSRNAGFLKLALTGAVLGLGLLAVYLANERTHASDPLDAVPADAFLVATADMERLRHSPIYDAVFGGDSGRSLGLSSVEAACGFDPVTRVTTIAFVVPEEGDHGEFGIAAKVNVTPDEIKACASKLSPASAASGATGNAGSDSELKKQGDFYIIEGRGASLPRLAYKPESDARGLLLVGKGTVVDSMMDAFAGKKPRLSSSKQHASLRAALSRQPAPALLVTSVLPESTRARIRGEMSNDVARGSADSMEMMSGVLSVDTAGAALVAGDAESLAEVRLELTCERPEACASVKTLLDRKKIDFQRNLGVRLVAGALLESFSVEETGTHLSAHTSARSAELAKMIERALAWRKRARDSRESADPSDAPNGANAPIAPNAPIANDAHSPSAPPQRPPDEVLGARRDAGRASSVAPERK